MCGVQEQSVKTKVIDVVIIVEVGDEDLRIPAKCDDGAGSWILYHGFTQVLFACQFASFDYRYSGFFASLYFSLSLHCTLKLWKRKGF